MKVFFNRLYNYGVGKEVFGFDLANGLFLHCQSEPDLENDRLITIEEYEIYGGYQLREYNRYSFVTYWKFHLKSLSLLSITKSNHKYDRTEKFFTILLFKR